MTETAIHFRSDVTVQCVRAAASDMDVVRAARVSTLGAQSAEQDDSGRTAGLINYLMRSRHGSPFEHSSFTFFIQAPIVVFREFQRHRIASYNEESARYRQLDPLFYLPDRDRKLIQVGKPGHYTFEHGTQAQYDLMVREHMDISTSCYRSYERQMSAGICREIARMVLPVNIYSSMYVTVNPRSLMNILSLRVDDENALFPSFPQREIEMVAEQIEHLWAAAMPLTHQAFVLNGRVTP